MSDDEERSTPKTSDDDNSLSILASPVAQPSTSRPTRRSFQIENIIKRIEASQKKIINFDEINQRVLKRVEAERAKETTPIDICKEQLNQFVSTDVHSEFYFGNALAEQRGIFTDQALTLFRLQNLYTDAKVKMGDFEKLIMSQPDANSRTKIALKLISVDKELHRTGAGKTLLIQQQALVKLDEMFPTLLKILINYGIELKLLDAHVHRYKNVPLTHRYRSSLRPRPFVGNTSTMEEFDLYACLPQVLDCLDMIVDDSKLRDSIMVHDFLAIVMLLFVDHVWSVNRICMRTLKQFLINIFARAERTVKTIATCTEAILKMFEQSYPHKLVEFLMFLPNRTLISKQIKFKVCQKALETRHVTVLKSVDSACDAIESLNESASALTYAERHQCLLIIRELLGSLGVEQDHPQVGASFDRLAKKLNVLKEDSDSLKLFNCAHTFSRFFDPSLDVELNKAGKPKRQKKS